MIEAPTPADDVALDKKAFRNAFDNLLRRESFFDEVEAKLHLQHFLRVYLRLAAHTPSPAPAQADDVALRNRFDEILEEHDAYEGIIDGDMAEERDALLDDLVNAAHTSSPAPIKLPAGVYKIDHPVEFLGGLEGVADTPAQPAMDAVERVADAIRKAGYIPWVDKRTDEEVRLEQAKAAIATIAAMPSMQPAYTELHSAVHALVGFCQALEPGTTVTEDYVKSLKTRYIPRVEKALSTRVQPAQPVLKTPFGLLDPDMPAQELRLHMGEMTVDEMMVARAAIRWANTRQPAQAVSARLLKAARQIEEIITFKGAIALTFEAVDAFRAAIAATEAERAQAAGNNGWMDISTAPFNESILIYLPNWDHYGPGIYRAIRVDMGTGERWHSTAWACGRDVTGDLPVAWMPLPPAPPTTLQADTKGDGDA